MPFEVVARASRAAGEANEDAAGFAQTGGGIFFQQSAWVLDGATGVAEREYVPGAATDAAWLASALSEEMAAEFGFNSGMFGATQYLARIVDRVAARYRMLVPNYRRLPRYARPSAAVMWLRATLEWIEFWHQGDCIAVVEQGDQIKCLGTVDRTGSDGKLQEMLAARVEGAANGLSTALVDELRRRRGRLNRPDGYWMMGIDRRAVKAMEFGIVRVRPGTRVLLCSDGYWRLVDHFRRYDAAELLRASFERGPEALLDELRALEMADPECRAVPRVKPMDDATALLLRF
jgi:hypothetical protein